VTTFNMVSLLSFRFEASFLSGRENSTTFNLLLYTLSHCHCVSVAKSNLIMNYPSHACSMVFWMCWQIEWPALCPRVRDTPVQLNLLISRHIPFVLSPPQIGQAGSVRSNIHEAGSVFRYWGVKGLRVLCIFWFFIFGLFISQFNMFNFGWYIFNFWWYLVRFYISSFIMFTFWWYLLSFWWYLMRFYISNSILTHEGHQPIQLFYLSNLPLKWRIRY
jgi:hypothetical protein